MLLERYHGVVFRYLLGAVRDAEMAQELAQEFAMRFLRGDFHRADPERGRFRDYLRTALSHLVDEHWRSVRLRPESLSANVAAPSEETDTGQDFLESWRQELLDRTWRTLQIDNPTYYAVLRFRVENPDLPSSRIAEELTASLGKPMTHDSTRKSLQRAREAFADLLLDEITQSLGSSSDDVLEDESRELDLLKYCRTALARRRMKR
jgi:RNA polymerase sigma-70 factor (ECF subfamily)